MHTRLSVVIATALALGSASAVLAESNGDGGAFDAGGFHGSGLGGGGFRGGGSDGGGFHRSGFQESGFSGFAGPRGTGRRNEEYATGIAGLLGIDAKKKRKTMSTTFRVVIAAALALGSTSAALAASEEAPTRTAITWNALRRQPWSKARVSRRLRGEDV